MLSFFRRHIAWGSVQIAYAVLFCFFYDQLVFSGFKEFEFKTLNMRSGEISFQILDVKTHPYLLKVWCRGYPSDVKVNGILIPHSFFRERKQINEFYFLLPEKIIADGRNTLALKAPFGCSVSIKNHFATSAMGSIFLKTKKGMPVRPFMASIFLFLAGFLLLGFLYNNTILKIFALLGTGRIGYWAYALSFLPIIIFYGFTVLLSMYSPMYFKFFSSGFFGLLFINFILAQVAALMICLLWKFSKSVPWTINIDKSEFFKKRKSIQVMLWRLRTMSSDRAFVLFLFILFLLVSCNLFGLFFLAEIFANLGFIALVYASVKRSRELR